MATREQRIAVIKVLKAHGAADPYGLAIEVLEAADRALLEGRDAEAAAREEAANRVLHAESLPVIELQEPATNLHYHYHEHVHEGEHYHDVGDGLQGFFGAASEIGHIHYHDHEHHLNEAHEHPEEKLAGYRAVVQRIVPIVPMPSAQAQVMASHAEQRPTIPRVKLK